MDMIHTFNSREYLRLIDREWTAVEYCPLASFPSGSCVQIFKDRPSPGENANDNSIITRCCGDVNARERAVKPPDSDR